MGFLWISEILNSKYREGLQHSMVGELVRLVEEFRDPHPYSNSMQSAWVPHLLKFLSLCENFDFTESPPHPALIALYILSRCPRVSDFGTTLLPTLTSLLSPNHRLQSRKLALNVFCRLTREWRSRTETVPGHHLDELLRAVGDPFHLPPEPPHDQVRKLERIVGYEPMDVVVALIGFAPSELWQGLLRPSNFTSCENTLSTDEGRRSVLGWMFYTILTIWPEFLCMPTKIVSVIRHLEELGCLNTAELVVTWAWVTGMADAMDQESWKLIGSETLRFYRAHGIRSLAALKRCIIRNSTEDTKGLQYFSRTELFAARYEGPPFRVGRSRRPSNLRRLDHIPYREESKIDCVISQTCQLRRLYRLFGYDPTTWEEAVGAGGADEKRKVSSGRSVMPDLFVDWECDYP